MKQEFYSDRDMTMLYYTHYSGIKFSLCNKRNSSNYLVQCTQLGIFFIVDYHDMGVKIMNTILEGGVKLD